MKRSTWMAATSASVVLLLAACGSDGVEQAEPLSVEPTAIATTAPIALPTSTPVPPTPLPPPTAAPTPLPPPTLEPTVAPTAPAPPTAEPTLAPPPTPAPVVEETAPTATATAVPAVVETPTPVPTQIVEDATATPVAEAPTAVVAATGETPLECFDKEIQVYRALVDGVDTLSFENGRVFCAGAGTNAVSAAGSYRHSSRLIVARNADYIFDTSGTGYIPYSGSLHYCLNGQPASAGVRADTVPALLIVIDNEAQRLVGQGATGPAAFTGNGAQC